MRIGLVAPVYLPARTANTIQVMKNAYALASSSYEVLMTIPGNAPEIPWEVYARHYGLPEQKPEGLEITYLKVNDSYRRYDYAFKALRRLRKWKADVLFTRLPQAAALSSWMKTPVIYEIHDIPAGKLGPRLFNAFLHGEYSQRLVSISQALLTDLTERYSFPAKPGFTLVAPDGVDIERYAELPPPSQARKRLGLPDKFTAGYTGHLYEGRGVALLLAVAQKLPQIQFLLVGGHPEDVSRVEKQIQQTGLQNIRLTGFVPNQQLPLYQAACDILLMPYQSRVRASSGGDIAKYLSPMKMFEYLASGRAILSSDLPVLQEVLTPESAILLPSDDPQIWAEAISALRADPQKAARLGSAARQLAEKYTWEQRVKTIFGHPESLID